MGYAFIQRTNCVPSFGILPARLFQMNGSQGFQHTVSSARCSRTIFLKKRSTHSPVAWKHSSGNHAFQILPRTGGEHPGRPSKLNKLRGAPFNKALLAMGTTDIA